MRPFNRLLACCSLVLLAGMLGSPVVVGAQQTSSKTTAAQAALPAGVPVVVAGKTLFTVREGLFTFSPAARAQTIAERVVWLSRQPEARIRAVGVDDEGNFTEVISGDTVLATVTDADAKAAGRTRQELATEYAGRIRESAEALRKQFSLRSILLAALYALFSTAVFVLLLKLMALAFPKFYAKLQSWHGVYIRSLRIQKLELVPADRITGLLRNLARLTRLLLTVALLYGYVTVTLSFFPLTQGFSDALLRYILWPVRVVGNAILAYLPNVFFVAVILLVAYYVIKFVKLFFTAVGRRKITLPEFFPEWAMPTYRIVRFLLIAFTAVVIFPYLPGSSSPAFRGVSIFLGLLFSLGSTSAIANVVAGSVLTYTRAFQVGDRVKIADATGDVISKTLLTTRIRTIKNEDVSIPNALVLGGHVVNYSSAAEDDGLILHTGVTIGFDAPWRTVHQLLIDAALATENVRQEPKPFVLQTALNDFYVSYQINAYTNRPAVMANTYSELHQNIQDKFNEAGVEIMSQHYMGVRDGNYTTIPEQYRPKDYEAPVFRVPVGPLAKPFKDRGPAKV
jgi:small-conductance mechanosensitive channel